MALQDTDLFVLYRPGTKVSYKLAASDLPSGSGAALPDGTEAGQIIEWDGANWVVATIDGGTF